MSRTSGPEDKNRSLVLFILEILRKKERERAAERAIKIIKVKMAGVKTEQCLYVCVYAESREDVRAALCFKVLTA